MGVIEEQRVSYTGKSNQHLRLVPMSHSSSMAIDQKLEKRKGIVFVSGLAWTEIVGDLCDTAVVFSFFTYI